MTFICYCFPSRNVTMDNFFTSATLAEKLLEDDLTLARTLRKCKPEIPLVMKPSKQREVHTSKYGFNDNMTMVSYVPKKKKAVFLLSTMHHDKLQDKEKRKSLKLLFIIIKLKEKLIQWTRWFDTTPAKGNKKVANYPVVPHD